MTWKLVFTQQAKKDAKKIVEHNLKQNVTELLNLLKTNPYSNPPPFEKLLGKLKGYLSHRINVQHRLIYQIYKKEKVVKIIRMWTHYE